MLKNAGAVLPKRDAVDARAVTDPRDGTGKIINNEEDVSAWPAYTSGKSAPCSANDGIPDKWRIAHGLPINDRNVASRLNADGYTTLEVYLNSLVSSTPQPSR